MHIHTHMHSQDTYTYAFPRQCISVCMRLYFLAPYIQICTCISPCISIQHTCFIQRRLLCACCALRRGRCAFAARYHTFLARSLHIRMIQLRRTGSAYAWQIGDFIQIRSARRDIGSGWLQQENRCLGTGSAAVVHEVTPIAARRGGAAMGNRIIPVEEVTPHNTNQELKCILKTSKIKRHKQS